MDTDALIKIINTSEMEKNMLKSFIDKYGFDALYDNLKDASLSTKAKMSITQLHQILHNSDKALNNLSALTEIPLKVLQQSLKEGERLDILEHPERLDIDSRQLFKFRCVNDVYLSYQSEQGLLRLIEQDLNHER